MFVKSTLLTLLAYSLPITLAAPSTSKAEGGTVAALGTSTISGRAPMVSTYYSGPWQNFPAMDAWMSFDDMFNANKPSMTAAGDTADDITHIGVAIQ